MTMPLAFSPEVSDALATGRPVVALESTIISHGLPRPRNLEAARAFEGQLRDAGVVPATIAVVDGTLRAGLTDDELQRIAGEDDVPKASMRDLPVVLARRGTAATTVAATSFIADHAGIRVFATGGLGGVHRGTGTFDESNDLKVLSEVPITVVSAGVKSVLDIGATLERLETLGVTVLGFGTDEFPSFWLRSSGEPLDWTVGSGADVAAVMEAREQLESCAAIVVANPLPLEDQLDPEVHDRALAEALRRCDEKGVEGKEVTPFLLSTIVELTGGDSLEVNLRIVRNNISVAAEIARAWAEL